jgi:hypothetical protein
MKLKLIALLVFIAWVDLAAGQTITDPAHIEVYVTPYYNPKGPTIDLAVVWPRRTNPSLGL